MTHSVEQFKDYRMNVADGVYSNAAYVRKFGKRSGVTSTEATVWLGTNGDLNFRTTAVTMYASCEDASATQTLYFTGQDANWKLQLGKVTLNGQNQVALTDLNGDPATWTVVGRGYQVSAGAAPSGDVWVAESDTLTAGVPNTATKEELHIEFGTNFDPNSSEKASIIVPSGKIGLITGWRLSLSQSSGTARHLDGALAITELALGATVGSPSWAPHRHIDELSVNTNMPHAAVQFLYPVKVTELTRIEIRVSASASSNVFASFTCVYVDED